MEVRPAAFVILTALVTAAAGAGGWLAVRQNRADAAGSEHARTAPASHPGEFASATDAATVMAVAAAGGTGTTEPDPPPAPDRAGPRPAETPAPVRTVNAGAGTETTTGDSGPAPEATAGLPAPPAEDLPPAPGDTHADGLPPTTGTAAAAPPAAASDLPRVTGWVRRTDNAVRADEDPPPAERLVIAAESVIGLQLETGVSSADARVEDDVVARIARNVLADGRTALPAGTRVLGSVVLVEQAGKLRGNPRLGVRFHTAVTDDGSEVPLATDAVYREGPGRGSGSTQRIGGAAVGGAILGAIFGGKRGAAIGSAAGAAGGTALAMAGDGPPATFQAGAAVTIRLLNPATVAVDRPRPGQR